MNNKKRIICFLCIALMLVSVFAVLAVDGELDAATAVYGSSMFSQSSGNASISSSLSGGLKITFNKSSESSDVSYQHIVDMKKFELSFMFADNNTNFEDMVFRFTDTDNDTKWIEVHLRKGISGGAALRYRLVDHENNRTDFKDVAQGTSSQIATNALESDLTLGFNNGNFYLISGKLAATNAVTVNLEAGNAVIPSFYKELSNLKIGVRGVENDTDDDDDVEYADNVLILKRWDNSLVEQDLDSSDNANYNDKLPVIIRDKSGSGNAVDITTSQAQPILLKGAHKYDFSFPYYCIDITGRGWEVKTKEPLAADGEAKEWDEIDKELNKRKHTLTLKSDDFGGVGDQKEYEFQIFNSSEATTPTLTLKVESVEDTSKPQLNMTALEQLISDTFTSKVIAAPKLNNTFAMPRITNGSNILVADPDGIDNYDNVKIEVGYKKPNSSDNFTYGSYDVKIDAIGEWFFTYCVTDQAGNKFGFNEGHKFDFSLHVYDDEGPVINASELIRASYITRPYTVPVPTITDNASGVNSSKTDFVVYKLKQDGTKGDLVELDEDKRFKFDIEKTPDGWEASYVVVFTAWDNEGNSSTAEMKIKITDALAEPDPPTLPINQTMETILIIIASVAGVALIVLIFINPSAFVVKTSGKPKKTVKDREAIDYDDDEDEQATVAKEEAKSAEQVVAEQSVVEAAEQPAQSVEPTAEVTAEAEVADEKVGETEAEKTDK